MLVLVCSPVISRLPGRSAMARHLKHPCRSPHVETRRVSSALSVDILSLNRRRQPPRQNLLDQHILPPKELLSQMEALADTEEPSSPPQFVMKELVSEGEDEWSWDGTKYDYDRPRRRSLQSQLFKYEVGHFF